MIPKYLERNLTDTPFLLQAGLSSILLRFFLPSLSVLLLYHDPYEGLYRISKPLVCPVQICAVAIRRACCPILRCAVEAAPVFDLDAVPMPLDRSAIHIGEAASV